MRYFASAVLGLGAVMFAALAAYDAALKNTWSPKPFFLAMIVGLLIIDIIITDKNSKGPRR